MWIFKVWAKSLGALRIHLEWSLFRPCLDSRFQGSVTALSPWLATPRLGVLGSQGEVGEAPLIIRQAPLGWESQGYNSLMCKGRNLSLLGGKARAQLPRGTSRAGSSAGLCCYSRRCQEALLAPSPEQLSTFIPNCFRD